MESYAFDLIRGFSAQNININAYAQVLKDAGFDDLVEQLLRHKIGLSDVNTAPGNEHGTLMPAFTFGAPHTICTNSPVPASISTCFAVLTN